MQHLRHFHFGWFSLLLFLFIGSVFFRHDISPFISSITTPDIKDFSQFWVDYIFFALVTLVAIKTFFLTKKESFWLIPFWVCIGSSLFVALFIQEVIFSGTSQLVLDYFVPERRLVTFPSLHVTLGLSMILPYLKIHKPWAMGWLFLVFLTGAFEVFSGEHVLSDVLGGAALGYLVSDYIMYLEERYHAISRVRNILHKDLEMRRQIAHALLGIIMVCLLMLGVLTPMVLGVIVVLGFILSQACKTFHVPIIYPILHFFERADHMKKFPGRGPFFFLLGSFLSVTLFPYDIALASIIILGIGDSFTNLIGRTFGKTHFFYNPKKTIEGPLYATLLAGISASFFVPITYAFTASLGALFFESLPLRIGSIEIDDNLTIPLVAGGILMALGYWI